MYKSPAERAYQVVIHLVVLAIMLSAVFPLVYVVGMSLTSQPELIRRNYFVILPEEPTLASYERILSSVLVWQAMLISVLRSTIGPLLTLAMTVTGAFVLSRKTLPGRNLLLFFVLATILFHGGLIPSYLVIKQLGLLDSFWVYIVPLLVDTFGLLVIKLFIEALPEEITDAARIDGAGEVQMLTRIVIPLAAPALAAIGLFNVVLHWNSWFDALVYVTNRDLYPLQLVLRNLLESTSVTNDQMNGLLEDTQRVSSESLKMATVLVAMIPVLCVYPFLQKHFVKGVYLGSVK